MCKVLCIQDTLVVLAQTADNKGHRPATILKQLHLLPGEFCCIFKAVTLVYTFLHSGHSSYFGPLLFIHYGRYGIR